MWKAQRINIGWIQWLSNSSILFLFRFFFDFLLKFVINRKLRRTHKNAFYCWQTICQRVTMMNLSVDRWTVWKWQLFKVRVSLRATHLVNNNSNHRCRSSSNSSKRNYIWGRCRHQFDRSDDIDWFFATNFNQILDFLVFQHLQMRISRIAVVRNCKMV